jgi:hypothetical protein
VGAVFWTWMMVSFRFYPNILNILNCYGHLQSGSPNEAELKR